MDRSQALNFTSCVPAGSFSSSPGPADRRVENPSNGPLVANVRPCFRVLQPRFDVERAVRHFHVNAIQSHRPAQRSEISHCVRSRRRGQAESAIQSRYQTRAVDLWSLKPSDLDVVHLAQRDIHWQFVGKGFFRGSG